MKKLYIQPQTDLMLTAPQSLICTSTTYGGETTSDGMGGEAPLRGFSGSTQGLKYLI